MNDFILLIELRNICVFKLFLKELIMNNMNRIKLVPMTLLGLLCSTSSIAFAEENETDNPPATVTVTNIGKEISVAKHLMDGSEYHMNEQAPIQHGRKLFSSHNSRR